MAKAHTASDPQPEPTPEPQPEPSTPDTEDMNEAAQAEIDRRANA